MLRCATERQGDVGVGGRGEGGELDELHHGAVLGDVEEGDLALVLALVSRLHRRDRQLSLGVVQAEAATGQQLALSLKYFYSFRQIFLCRDKC